MNVYHVKQPFTLIQAAGYLKHTRAAGGKAIYFRGQSKLHKDLKPSLFRGLATGARRSWRVGDINAFLTQVRKDQLALRAVPEAAQEAVLQHYGLRTQWLDVVDNVWIALWFACHKALTHGTRGEHLHFEKRVPRHLAAAERYAYILLLESARTPNTKKGQGFAKDTDSETIDLRVAVPSHFIRPHVQHGLVIRKLDGGETSFDFSRMIVGIIRVDLDDALEWLGVGDLLSVHALFPPPPYDFGYREVLEGVKPTAASLGAIHHIGA